MLIKSLAVQREAYLKEKYQRQNDLKHALDSQVKNKPTGLPKVVPDSEVFGLNDAKNEKLAVMKKKEVDAFKYHKDLIEQRRREQLLNQLRDQERDYENLERSKEELVLNKIFNLNSEQINLWFQIGIEWIERTVLIE